MLNTICIFAHIHSLFYWHLAVRDYRSFLVHNSTPHPSLSGASLITPKNKVWALHRHRDKDPHQLSTGHTRVGVRKEGCALKSVWDAVSWQCSQTTLPPSNLYALLAPLAKHPAPTSDFVNAINIFLEDRTMFNRQTRLSIYPLSNGAVSVPLWYEEEGLKGLPVKLFTFIKASESL